MTEPSAGLEQEETEHDVDLIHECVVKMAKEISDFMDITPDKQRMDSLMVAANIRNLSLLFINKFTFILRLHISIIFPIRIIELL